MIDESKNVQTTPTHTYCKHNRPLPSGGAMVLGKVPAPGRPTIWLGNWILVKFNVHMWKKSNSDIEKKIK